MKKKKTLFSILSVSAVLGSPVFIAACAQFGSSSELPRSDGNKIIVKTDTSVFGKPSEIPIPKDDKNPKTGTDDTSTSGTSGTDTGLDKTPKKPKLAPGLGGVNVVPDSRKVSQNFIRANQKIKYVAIGDSITAGFDGTLDKDYQGERNDDGEITGLSYASFLARALNEDSRVESYNNYAISGATLFNWIDILNLKHKNQRNRSIGALKRFYGPNYLEKTNKIINEVKNSNLITLTLGANDFLQSLITTLQKQNIIFEISQLQDNSHGYGVLIEKIKIVLDDTVKAMTETLIHFTNQLKELAPNSNINYVSYPLPLLRLKNLLDGLLGPAAKQLNFKLSEFLLSQINGAIGTVASRANVNYVNIFNQNFWESNANKLTDLFFDIHPNVLGYKKIALDIYLKITNNMLTEEEYKKLGNFDFSKNYIESDATNSSYQIEVDDYAEKVRKYFGLSSNDYLNKQTKYEKDVEGIKSVSNYGFRIQHLANDYKFLALGFFNIITQTNLYTEIDPTSRLRTFLFENGAKRLNSLIDWFLKSNYLQKVLTKSEEYLDKIIKKDITKPVTADDVVNAFKSSLQNEEALFILIKSFINSDFVSEFGEEFTDVIAFLMPGSASEKLHELFAKYVPSLIKRALPGLELTDEELKKTLSSVVSKEDLSKIVVTVLETITKNNIELKNVNNFQELFAKFVLTPQVSKQLKVLSSKILNNPDSENLLASFVQAFVKNPEISWVFENVSDVKALLKNVFGLYRDLDSRFNFSADIVDSILQNIKQHGFETKKWDIPKQLFKIIGEKWGNNLEANIVELVKTLATSKFANQNSQDLKIIILNVFNRFKNSKTIFDTLLNIIPENKKEEINRIIGDKNAANNFVKEMLNTPEFNKILNVLVDGVILNLNTFNQVGSFNDIIVQTVKNIDLNSLKDSINLLIIKATKHPTFKTILNNFGLNILNSKLNINVDKPSIKKLIFDLTDQLPEFLKLTNIQNIVVDSIFKNLEKIKTSSTLTFNLNSIPADIFQSFLSEIQKDPFGYVSKILDFKALKDNQEAFIEVVKNSYKTVIKTIDLTSTFKQITKSLKEDPRISKWVDFDELNAFAPKIIKNENFENILLSGIEYLIKNVDNWKGKVNNFDTFISYILSSNDFKQSISSDLKKLIDFSLKNVSNLDKTINKIAIEVIKTLGVDLTSDLNVDLTSKAVSLLIETFKEQNSYDEILNSIITIFNSNTSVNSILPALTNLAANTAQKIAIPYLNKLLNSDLLKNNKDKFKAIFGKLVDQLLTSENLEKILSLKTLEDKALEFGILNYAEIKKELARILTSTSLKQKYNVILDAIVDNNELLKNKNTVFELLDAIVKIPTVNSNINLILKEVLQNVISSPQFKPTFKNVLQTVSNSTSYSWLFEGVTNKQGLIDSITNDFVSLVSKHKLTNKLSDAVSETLKTFTITNQSEELFKNILSSFVAKFNNEAENVELIKDLLIGTTFTNSLSDVVQIISNVIKKLGTDDKFLESIINLLPAKNIVEINKYISTTDLKTVVKALINDKQASQLLFSFVKALNIKSIDLTSAKTYGDLVKIIFKNINFAVRKSEVKTLAESFLSNTEVKKVFAKLITNTLNINLKLNGEKFNNLAKSVSDNLISTLKDLGIYDTIFETLLSSLDKSKGSSNPFESFAEIPTILAKKLLEKVESEPVKFVQSLLKSKIVSENSPAIVEILSEVLTKYLTPKNANNISSIFINFIKQNNLINKNLKYLDLDEIQKLISSILVEPSFKNIILSILPNILNNEELKTGTFTSLEQFILKVLQVSKILENKTNLTTILDKYVNSKYLSNTINKTLNQIIKDNNINDLVISKKLSDDLLDTSYNFVKQIDLINIALGVFNLNLQNPKSVNDWIQKSIADVSKQIDITNFKNFKLVLTSKVLSRNYPEVKIIIEKIWTWFKNNKLESTILSLLNKGINIDLDKAVLTKAFVEIAKSDSVVKLIELITNELINNFSTYETADSYENLVKMILNNDGFVTKAKSVLISLVTEILNNETVKTKISESVVSYLDSSKYAEFLTGITNKKELVTSLIELLPKFDKHLSLFNNLLDGTILEIKRNGFGFSVGNIIQNTINSIKTTLSDNRDEKIFALIMDVLNSDLISKHTNDVKTLIYNVFNYFNKNQNLSEIILNVLPTKLKDQLVSYSGGETNINQFLTFVLNTTEFKNITKSLIDASLNNVEKLKTATSLKDLVIKSLTILDLNTIKTQFNALLNKVLSNQSFQNIIYSASIKLLKEKFNVNTEDASIIKLVRELANQIPELVKLSDIQNVIINTTFSELEKAKTSQNPIEVLEKLPNQIILALTDIIKNNPFGFVNKLVSFKSIADNKEALLSVIKTVYKTSVANQEDAKKIVNSLLSSFKNNEAISKWVDFEELSSIGATLLQNTNFQNLTFKGIEFLVNNPEQWKSVNDVNGFINYVLSASEFKETIKEEIKEIINFTVDNINQIPKTINKVFVETIKSLGVDLSSELSPKITQKVVNLLIETLKDSGSYNGIVSDVVRIVSSGKTPDAITQPLKSLTKNTAQKEAFNFIKKLINSDLLTSNKEVFKVIISKVTDKLLTAENLAKVLSLGIIEQKAVELGISNYEKIKIELSKILVQPSLKAQYNKILNSVIDNSELLKGKNTILELLDAIVKMPSVSDTLNVILKDVLTQLTKNNEFKPTIVNILNKVSESSEVSWLFKGISNKSKLFNSLAEDFVSISNKYKFIDVISDALTNALKVSSISVDTTELIANVTDALKKYLSNESNNVEIIKDVIKSKTLTSNIENFKTLITNVSTRLGNNDAFIQSILNIIPKKSLTELNKYISNNDLKLLIKTTFSQEEVPTLITSIISQVNLKKLDLSTAKTYNDLIKLIFKNVDFVSNKSALTSIVEKLLTNSDVQQVFAKTLSNALKIHLDLSGTEFDKLSQDLFKNINKLLKDLGVLDSILDAGLKTLNKIKTSKNPIQTLSNISTDIIQSVIAKITSKPVDFIQTILKSPVLSENQSAISMVFDKLIEKLLSPKTASSLSFEVTKLFSKEGAEKLLSYLDIKEIESTLSKVFVDPNFKNLLSKAFLKIIENNEIKTQTFASTEEFIIKLLNVSKIFDNSIEIEALLEKYVTSQNLSNSFNKAINKILRDNNLIDITISKTLSDDLLDNLFTITKRINLISVALSSLKFGSSDTVSFEEFTKKSLIRFKKEFDITDFQNVKAILESKILARNYSEVKTIISKTWNWFKQNQLESLIANLLNKNSISGLDKTRVAKLIKEVANDSNVSKILDILTEEVINNWDEYKAADSYERLVQLVFHKQKTVDKLKPIFSGLIKSTFANNITKTEIVELINNFISKPEYTSIFKGVSDKKLLISNLLDVFGVIDKNVNLSDKLFEGFVSEIKSKGFGLSISGLITNSINSIIASFKVDGQEKLFKLLIDILNTDFIKTNGSDIKIIIKNIFDIAKADNNTVKKILDSLSPEISSGIYKYIGKESFEKLIKYILGNSNFQLIVDNLITLIFDNVDELKSSRDLNDLIKKALKIVKPDQLRVGLKGLINDLLTNPQTKELLKNVLVNTLTSWKINTLDPEINGAINALIDNLESIVNSLDIVDPLIDKIFDVLKKAADSDKPADILGNITKELTSVLEEKIFSSPSTFARQIFVNPKFSAHNNGIIKMLQGAFKHFNETGKIFEFISNSLNNLKPNNPIFETISIENLKELIKIALQNPHFSKLANSTIEFLIKNNRWVDALDSKNFETIVLAILKTENYIDSNKTDFKEFIKTLVVNEQFTNVITKIITKVADDNNLDFSIPDRNQFINNVAKNIISILQDTGIFDKVIDDLFVSLKKATSFEQIFIELQNSIVKHFDFNDFSLIKRIISLPIFKTNPASVKLIINKLYSSFIKNDKLVKTLVIDNLLKFIPKEYDISEASLSDAVRVILNLDETKKLINLVIENFVTNIDDYKAANSYEDLLKIFVSQNQLISSGKNVLNDLFNKLLENESVLVILSKIATVELQKLPNNWLLKNINDPLNFVKGLLKSLVSANKSFNLVKNASDMFVNESRTKGSKVDFSTILTSLVEGLKSQFKDNWEEKILDFIKNYTKNELFRNENARVNLQTLIKNIFNYFTSDSRLSNVIYESISKDVTMKLEVFLPKEKLISLFDKLLKDPALNKIIDNIVSTLVDNIDKIQKSKNLIDVIKLFLFPRTKSQELIKNVTDLVTNTLAQSETKTLLNNSVISFIEYIGAPITPSIRSIVTKITNDFGGLLKRVGIIDQLVNGFMNSLTKGANFTEVFENLIKNTVSTLQLNNYEFISKLLNDPLVTNNRREVKELLNTVVTHLLKNDGKLGEVISVTNISKLFTGDLQVNSNIVNDMITAIFKNNDFLKVITRFIDEIVDRNTTYGSSRSWEESLNKFFNSPASETIKTQLKKWLVSTLNDTSGNFSKGLAEIISGLMIRQGYAITEADKPFLTRVFGKVLAKLTFTPEFDAIIDNVFVNIKKINFNSVSDSTSAITNAISTGILSIITTDDGTQLSLDKIFNKNTFVKSLVNTIDRSDYVDFINFLYEKSNLKRKTGIYAFIANSIAPVSTSPSPTPPKPGGPTLSVKLDVYIWDYLKKGRDFLEPLFTPIYSQLFKKTIQNNSYVNGNHKNTKEYKALFRLTATLAWVIYDQMEKEGYSFFFWNGTYSTVEALLNYALEDAYTKAFKSYEAEIKRINNRALLGKLGISYYPGNWIYNKSWTYISTYIVGDRSNTTRNSNYYNDQLLAYIWYRTSYPRDRHSRKTKTEVLYEALEKGYLG